MADRGPKLPAVAVNYFGEQHERIDLRLFADMSPTQARAMTDTAKYTYAVPARQETYRLIATLILVGVLLYFLVPAFLASHPKSETLALVIAVIVAIAGAGPAIKAIRDAFKS